MRWLPILILTPLLAFTPVSAAAQSAPATAGETKAPPVQDLIKGVEAAYTDVESIQASFVQVTENAMMGDSTRQEGTVEIKRPRKMRWEFASPKSSFVTDGSTMWVYTAADNQVIVTEDLGTASSGDGMSALLDGLDKLGELFEVSRMAEAPEGSVRLRLQPKTQANFKALELTLAAEDYLLQEVVMVDPFDNRTTLSFSGVKLDAGLDDSRFVFEAPAGASVVKTSGS